LDRTGIEMRDNSTYVKLKEEIVVRTLVRICASALITLGVSLLAWISYDATAVLQALGSQNLLDEAGVALGGLLISLALIASGLFSWRQARSVRTV